RLVARHAKGEEVRGWIEKTEAMTCVALRRALQAKDEAQMCARRWTDWSGSSACGAVTPPPPRDAKHPRAPTTASRLTDASRRCEAMALRVCAPPGLPLKAIGNSWPIF